MHDNAFVKKFTEERELTVMLMVDVSASGQFGGIDLSKRELAAEVASVLAFSATRNNDKVGLLLFSDHVELYIPPKKGRPHALRLIREILFFEPKGRGTSPGPALDYLNRVVTRRAVVFLISDFQAEGFEKSLSVTARRHDLVAIPVDRSARARPAGHRHRHARGRGDRRANPDQHLEPRHAGRLRAPGRQTPRGAVQAPAPPRHRHHRIANQLGLHPGAAGVFPHKGTEAGTIVRARSVCRGALALPLLILSSGVARAQFSLGGAPEASPTPAIHDIRPPLDVFPYPMWMVVVAAVILLHLLIMAVTIIVVLIRNRPKPPPPTPRETALRRLAEAEPDAARKEPYTFSIRVSDILRQYVSAQYALHATEQTSPEFLADAARSPHFTAADKRLVADFLDRCDLIKFAHVDATSAENRALLDQAVLFVKGAAL